MLAAYTGAWYPTYFEVGVNWASRNYDVSKDFSWATPDYKIMALQSYWISIRMAITTGM